MGDHRIVYMPLRASVRVAFVRESYKLCSYLVNQKKKKKLPSFPPCQEDVFDFGTIPMRFLIRVYIHTAQERKHIILYEYSTPYARRFIIQYRIKCAEYRLTWKRNATFSNITRYCN